MTQDTIYVFSEINIVGNTKTKQVVILRELPFSLEDSIYLSEIQTKLKIAQQNLLKTSLFNFVTLSFSLNKNNITIEIIVEERWYLWPYPILEHGTRNWATFFHDRVLSRVNYGAAFECYNIGGLDQTLKIKLRAGYREHFSISYFFNGLGKNRNSSIKTQVELFRQKMMVSQTLRNQAEYYNDKDNYVFENFNSTIVVTHRMKLSAYAGAGISYKDYYFVHTSSPSPINENYEYLSTKFLNPFAYFKADTRDNKVYPLNGMFFNIFLGYWQNLSQNTSSFLGLISDLSLHYNMPIERVSLHTQASYRQLVENNPDIALFQNRLMFGRDFWTRGYEYYYFLGRKSFKLQNTVSFLLSDFKIHRLPNFLPDEFRKIYSRVYFDVFLDFIYTDGFSQNFNAQNPMNGKVRETYGAGVSLETYYDRLFQIYVAYMPYSKKTGIFVNYQTPILKLF